MNFKKNKTKLLSLAKSRTGVTQKIKIRIASQEEYARYLLNNEIFFKACSLYENAISFYENVVSLFPVCVDLEKKEILINPYDIKDAREEYWLGILVHEIAHIENPNWNEEQCNEYIKSVLNEEEYKIFQREEAKIMN